MQCSKCCASGSHVCTALTIGGREKKKKIESSEVDTDAAEGLR